MAKAVKIAGQNVERLRKALDVSVPKLSELTGVPVSRIYGWARGDGAPKGADTFTLCNFFQIPAETLHNKTITASAAARIIEALQAEQKLNPGAYKKNVNKNYKIPKKDINVVSGTGSPVDSAEKLNLNTVRIMAGLQHHPQRELLAILAQSSDKEEQRAIRELIDFKEKYHALEDRNQVNEDLIKILLDKIKTYENGNGNGNH